MNKTRKDKQKEIFNTSHLQKMVWGWKGWWPWKKYFIGSYKSTA